MTMAHPHPHPANPPRPCHLANPIQNATLLSAGPLPPGVRTHTHIRTYIHTLTHTARHTYMRVMWVGVRCPCESDYPKKTDPCAGRTASRPSDAVTEIARLLLLPWLHPQLPSWEREIILDSLVTDRRGCACARLCVWAHRHGHGHGQGRGRGRGRLFDGVSGLAPSSIAECRAGRAIAHSCRPSCPSDLNSPPVP